MLMIIFLYKKISLDEIKLYDDGKRILLYSATNGNIKNILLSEIEGKLTEDVVIVEKSMNKKAYYTEITRTTRNIFKTIDKII